jgi:hypothetical protein
MTRKPTLETLETRTAPGDLGFVPVIGTIAAAQPPIVLPIVPVDTTPETSGK